MDGHVRIISAGQPRQHRHGGALGFAAGQALQHHVTPKFQKSVYHLFGAVHVRRVIVWPAQLKRPTIVRMAFVSANLSRAPVGAVVARPATGDVAPADRRLPATRCWSAAESAPTHASIRAGSVTFEIEA